MNTITASATYGDSNVSANSVVGLDASVSSGSGLTLSNNAIVIGAGISRVIVAASVFYTRLSADYSWYGVYKNGAGTGTSAITTVSSGYGTATVAPKILDVREGDTITLYNFDAGKVRGTGTWLTVIAIG